MRWNHLIVDDVPCQFDSRSTHSLRFPETDCTIPLRLQGIMSTFPICAPTQEEKEECTHLPLTSRERWEPNSDLLANEEEQTTVRLQVDVSSSSTWSTRGLYAIESQSTCLRDISPVICEMNRSYEDRCFLQDLCASVRVCSSAVSDRHVNAVATYEPNSSDVVSAVHTIKRNLALDPISLSKRWQIGLDTAKATLKVTTQRGIRTAINPCIDATGQILLSYDTIDSIPRSIPTL